MLALVARSGDVVRVRRVRRRAGAGAAFLLMRGSRAKPPRPRFVRGRGAKRRVVVSEDRDSCVHPHFIAIGAAAHTAL